MDEKKELQRLMAMKQKIGQQDITFQLFSTNIVGMNKDAITTMSGSAREKSPNVKSPTNYS